MRRNWQVGLWLFQCWIKEQFKKMRNRDRTLANSPHCCWNSLAQALPKYCNIQEFKGTEIQKYLIIKVPPVPVANYYYLAVSSTLEKCKDLGIISTCKGWRRSISVFSLGFHLSSAVTTNSSIPFAPRGVLLMALLLSLSSHPWKNSLKCGHHGDATWVNIHCHSEVTQTLQTLILSQACTLFICNYESIT